MAALQRQLAQLTEHMRELRSVVVAYSGGVDSALVAAVAHRTLGAKAIAVTAAAETLAGKELEHARLIATEIGIVHRTVTYSELNNPEFVRNPKHRCYVCQGMRMDHMLDFAQAHGFDHVCDGTNASDPGPDRPGLEAVRERGVVSPLLAARIDKATTRALARHLGLSVADRPANACLSSRIPHGQPVTLIQLNRVEHAESLLAAQGFHVVRVRADRVAARVEVGTDELASLHQRWSTLEPELLATGFDSVTIDARGYASGGADRDQGR